MNQHDDSLDAAIDRHPAGTCRRREIRRHGIEHSDPLTTAQHAHDELDIQPLYGKAAWLDRIVYTSMLITTVISLALIILGVQW